MFLTTNNYVAKFPIKIIADVVHNSRPIAKILHGFRCEFGIKIIETDHR